MDENNRLIPVSMSIIMHAGNARTKANEALDGIASFDFERAKEKIREAREDIMSQGLTDSSFKYHLESAKKNGITKEEIAEILTHAAFYAGWPKAWAAFRMAKKVWGE